MTKYMLLMVASLWAVACSAHNEHYYRTHPKALQAAIQQCPAKSPSPLSCAQLKDIALRVNELAYQLRLDPQGYGQKILVLQEIIARQEANREEKEQQPSLDENKIHLQERLAIVKWLESPTS